MEPLTTEPSAITAPPALWRRYATQRLLTALTPLAHWQRAPYCSPPEQLTIETADGVPIAATLLRRGSPQLVIICHGFASTQRSLSIVWLAEALAERFDVLTFDWRGYGASGGLASLGRTEMYDLAAVLNWSRTRGYAQVGVIGESMGGLITLVTLGLAPADLALPDRVATIGAPADYALTAGPRPYLVRNLAPQSWARPFAPLLGFRLGPVDPPRPLDVVHQITQPLLLLHGDADNVVPIANAHQLAAALPQAELRVYPGVNHGIIALRSRAPAAVLTDLTAYFAAM